MLSTLEEIISAQRLAPYKKGAGQDIERALELYAWNMKIGAAFLPLFSATEVSLRNLTVKRLTEVYADPWWQDQRLLNLLEKKGKGVVKQAEGRIKEKGQDPDSGRMTAELGFGFWENMFLEKYTRDLWVNLHDSFPHLPSTVDQQIFKAKCQKIRKLRNRIAQHEPIFHRNLSQDYAHCLELIRWLSPAKVTWIRPHCAVATLLRAKP